MSIKSEDKRIIDEHFEKLRIALNQTSKIVDSYCKPKLQPIGFVQHVKYYWNKFFGDRESSSIIPIEAFQSYTEKKRSYDDYMALCCEHNPTFI
ncbi:hypothetical protein ADUPG1_007872 [Aduncisulcus paluster]|uniref:Uncharacterized protein n=1 Tax=Aduncisulcus paluster TaxID=2918883 RepID=A0ABQ5KPZ1_9EUKA|nr:hypothetical protein ADUPG1_007872 [Aduncisulcus paluster]